MILMREVHSSRHKVHIGIVKIVSVEGERKKGYCTLYNPAIKLATYIRQTPPIYAWYRINYAR